MYELPITVNVNNKNYAIRNRADYRVIMDVIAACQDVDFTKEEQAATALILFYEALETYEDIFITFEDIKAAITAMMNFISLNNDEVGYKSNHKLIDWEQDEDYIVSAINGVAKTEIRALPYLHWWTFISYYMAIGDCSLQTIVGIRDKIAKGKKLEKYEQEFKRNNPQLFKWKTKRTEEEKEFISQIDALWG